MKLYQRWVFIVVMLVSASKFGFAETDEEFYKSIVDHRVERDFHYQNEGCSPFTAIGKIYLTNNRATRVSLPSDTLLMGVLSADVGIPILEITWKKNIETIYARTPMGGEFRMRGRLLKPVPSVITPGDTIHAEKYLLIVIQRGDRVGVMAYDPSRASGVKIKDYAPDPRFKVTANLFVNENPDTLTMSTSDSRVRDYLAYARVEFTLLGQKCQLTLFSDLTGKGYGFLPFTDETTGVTSYDAGRYLDFEMADILDDTLTLDFNMAYNPYCAYVKLYSCPIPPAENHLPVLVTAGEKRYWESH
jgi:uncharacterized protein